MPKFSIIIPVYNVDKYLKRCLDSVKYQTFTDFEVIVINDGSTDKSEEIASKYNYQVITTKHYGVSSARNLGIKKAKGEYLVFLDSDDFLEKDLLRKLAKNIEDNPDILRFQVQTVNDQGEIVKYEEEAFNSLSGEEAFKKITKYHFVENAWCYIYKRSYFLKEKFKFMEDTVHEDYGLIPLVIIKASSVKAISYIGYNYYRRSGSIMNNKDYEWTKRKVKDFYNHYLYLDKEIAKTNINSKVFKSFIANSLILKICELKKNDYKIYRKKLVQDKVFDNLLKDTFPRKIKYLFLKISPKIYYKFVK